MKLNSIQANITFWAGLCLALVVVILSATTVFLERQIETEDAETYLESVANTHASEIQATFGEAMRIAHTVGDVLVAAQMDAGPGLTRSEVNAILRQVLLENPTLLGIYTLWEPDAFDGNDAAYVNTEGHDDTGRLIPYWARGADGSVGLEALIDYEVEGVGEYYLCPKRTLSPCIIEPFFYPVQGRDVLLTSLTLPIIIDGEFVGITGIDMRLDFLQTLTDQVDVYQGTGTLLLVTHGGIIAGASGLPEFVGQPLSEYHSDWENDLITVQSGQTVIQFEEGDASIAAFVPIHIGETTTPWSVNLNIPMTSILASVNAQAWRTAGIGTLVSMIGLVFLWVIAGRLAKPIRTMTRLARQISQGDLELDVHVTTADETGQLAIAFQELTSYVKEVATIADGIAAGNLTATVTPRSDHDILSHAFIRMTAGLSALIGSVRRNAENVKNASDQLIYAADQSGQATQQIALTIGQVAQGNAQQAASVEHTRAIIEHQNQAIGAIVSGVQRQGRGIQEARRVLQEQLAYAIQQVNTSAAQSKRSSQDAETAAEHGATAIQKIIEGMKGISTGTQQVSLRVTEMEHRSQEIGQIVQTIDEIAERTNLLALNAAIEAARAGEHGKGFAVVADEVRKLAEQSGRSAQEITQLVYAVQQTAKLAAVAMEQGSRDVDQGVALAGDAELGLTQIQTVVSSMSGQMADLTRAVASMGVSRDALLETMEQVATIVEENTTATEKLYASSEQVLMSMEEVASVSEENSAAAEEVSAGAEEVSAQVEETTASANSLGHHAQELLDITARFQLEKATQGSNIPAATLSTTRISLASPVFKQSKMQGRDTVFNGRD